MTSADHATYAEWDAAYVLGALSPAERREFETHLEECDRCQAAVAELSALPGLLGRLGKGRALALLEDPADADADAGPGDVVGPPADLVARIQRTERSRRLRSRIATLGGLAAAAAIAAVLALVLPSIVSPAPAPAIAAELAPVADGVAVEADVALTQTGWGTRIDMNCSYRLPAGGADGSYGAIVYAMWVVDRQGNETALSTWRSEPTGTVKVSAGTALAVADIAQIEIRTVSGNQVLLEADL